MLIWIGYEPAQQATVVRRGDDVLEFSDLDTEQATYDVINGLIKKAEVIPEFSKLENGVTALMKSGLTHVCEDDLVAWAALNGKVDPARKDIITRKDTVDELKMPPKKEVKR